MAPTVVVGDDETPAEVAKRLLDLADSQNDVQLRTDVSGATAFAVPDKVYAKYAGRKKRGDTEQQLNAVEEQGGDAAAVAAIVGDETPAGSTNADPSNPDASLAGPITGDPMPDSAKVVEPPSNGEPDASTADGSPAHPDGAGDQGAGDEGGDQPPADDKPKPRKRTSRARKSTPGAAASGDGK